MVSPYAGPLCSRRRRSARSLRIIPLDRDTLSESANSLTGIWVQQYKARPYLIDGGVPFKGGSSPKGDPMNQPGV